MISIKTLKVADCVNNIKNKKKRKFVDSVNNHNRNLIIGFSNCVKTYLMSPILHEKQESFFSNHKSTKSICENQSSNIT